MGMDQAPKEPFEEQRDVHLAKLEAEHPDIIPVIEKLQDPKLSKENFFALVDEFRTSQESAPERTGIYNEVRFDVADIPERYIKVKWFKNGRIEISGVDYSA